MFAQIQNMSEITQLAATRERIIKAIAVCETDLPKFSIVDSSAPVNYNVGHNLFINKYKNGNDLSIDLSACYIASEVITSTISALRIKKANIESRLLVLGVQSIPDVIPLSAKASYEKDAAMIPFVIPVNGGNGGQFAFSSSNNAVAVVNSVNGVVTPIAQGSATITVNEIGTSNSTTISVVVYARLTVTRNLYLFTDSDLSSLVYFAGGSGVNSFSSSNVVALTVNSTTGALTLVADGVSIIQVTDTKTERAINSIVNIVPHMVLTAETTATIAVPYSVTTSGGSGVVRYSIDNPEIATIDVNTGAVTVLTLGTFVIVATDLNTLETKTQSVVVS